MSTFIALNDLGYRFALNIVAAVILILGMFYRRHKDRDLAITAIMFNLFAFAVLYKLSSVEFSLAAGFGLFAILALFNLRSEPIDRIQIAYFFGAVAIAVICSVAGTPMVEMVFVTAVVLLGVYVVDHPALWGQTKTIKLTLDEVDLELLSDPSVVAAKLNARLGVQIDSFEVVNLSLNGKGASIRVTYQVP